MNIIKTLQNIGKAFMEDSDGDDSEGFIVFFGLTSLLVIVAAMIAVIMVLAGNTEILTHPVTFTLAPWIMIIGFGFTFPIITNWLDYATYNKFKFSKLNTDNVIAGLVGLWVIYIVLAIFIWAFIAIPVIMTWFTAIFGLLYAITKLSRKIFKVADTFDTHTTDPDAHKK